MPWDSGMPWDSEMTCDLERPFDSGMPDYFGITYSGMPWKTWK